MEKKKKKRCVWMILWSQSKERGTLFAFPSILLLGKKKGNLKNDKGKTKGWKMFKRVVLKVQPLPGSLSAQRSPVNFQTCKFSISLQNT